MSTSDTTDIRIVALGPGDAEQVYAAAACFDHEPQAEATDRFLRSPDHHLLLAYVGDESTGATEVAGMITGVEMTHPDKGTEMFLYELGVREEFRNRRVGRTLVRALADLAIERGCYGMWVLTDDDNPAAIRAYTAGGGTLGEQARGINWTFTAEQA